jgi:hypothetical protein
LLGPGFLAVVELEVIRDAEFFEEPEDTLALGVLMKIGQCILG